MDKVELITPRISIGMLDVSHAADVLRYFEDNREHLRISNPVLPRDFYSEEFWIKRLDRAFEEYESDKAIRLFVSERKNPQTVIGSISFTQIFRGPFQACYLGYSLSKKFEGQGYMFEALQAAIQFVFEKRHIHRVMANYLPENTRSGNVLKRLGFRIDGQSPEYLFINGAWRDHVLTSLTNPRWTPREEDREIMNL